MSAQATQQDAVQEFYDRKSTEGSVGTADRYLGPVQRWIAWLSDERDKSMWEAETADLRRYLRGMVRQNYAPDTIKVYRAAISQFYQKMNDAWEEDEIDVPDGALTETDNGGLKVRNPSEDLDLSGWKHLKKGTKKSQHAREDIYFLEDDKIDALIEHAPSPKLRNTLILRLLLNCGLRRSECATIRISDIDPSDRSIHIRAVKTETNRTVYYPAEMQTLIDLWLSERRMLNTAEDSVYLFPTRESEHIDSRYINDMVKRAAEDAGIQEVLGTDNNGNDMHKITAHTLRHTYAVSCVREGMDIVRLAQLMGHFDQRGAPNIDTTRKYLRFKQEDVKDAARQYGPSF